MHTARPRKVATTNPLLLAVAAFSPQCTLKAPNATAAPQSTPPTMPLISFLLPSPRSINLKVKATIVPALPSHRQLGDFAKGIRRVYCNKIKVFLYRRS